VGEKIEFIFYFYLIWGEGGLSAFNGLSEGNVRYSMTNDSARVQSPFVSLAP